MPFDPTNGPVTFIMMIHNVDSVWKETTSLIGLSVGTNVDTKLSLTMLSIGPSHWTLPCNISNVSFALRRLIASLSAWRRDIFPLVCWDRCLPRWKPPGHVQTQAIAKLAYPIASMQRCQLCQVSPILQQIHLLLWNSCWPTPVYYVTRVYRACWGHTDSCCAINIRFSSELHPWRSLSTLFWPCKVNCPTHWFFIKGLWLCCFPTWRWWRFFGTCFVVYVRQWISFLTKTNGRVLHPVAFGGRRARGSEKYLHLYLGEAFCGNNAMNKFHRMC